VLTGLIPHCFDVMFVNFRDSGYVKGQGVLVASRGHSSEKGSVSVASGLFRFRVLVASCGHSYLSLQLILCR
jgi:hypothetical protein